MIYFDMPDGYHGFLFRGADGELYFARFAGEWRVSEFAHLALGRTLYKESGAK